MKKTLIFSDVHLKVTPEEAPRRQQFIEFLRGISPEEYDRVVCLGDLFDFWFEYRHVVFSGYFEILRVFAEMRDAGIELHLVCGNHDFWAGRFLRDTLHFQIHPRGVILPLGEKRVLFVHGDGLNPADRSYRFYKRFARNRWVIACFRLLHPDFAMRIAQGVSHSSRTLQGEYDTSTGPEARALRAYGEGVIARGEADVVMCGHAHAPVCVACPGPGGEGFYVNTGDWVQHRSYVVWDGAHFHLHDFGAAAPIKG